MSSQYHNDNDEDRGECPSTKLDNSSSELDDCLFCECHLVSILEIKHALKVEFKENFNGNSNLENAFIDYLKVNKIAGHGCGNCVKGLAHLCNLFT